MDKNALVVITDANGEELLMRVADVSDVVDVDVLKLAVKAAYGLDCRRRVTRPTEWYTANRYGADLRCLYEGLLGYEITSNPLEGELIAAHIRHCWSELKPACEMDEYFIDHFSHGWCSKPKGGGVDDD